MASLTERFLCQIRGLEVEVIILPRSGVKRRLIPVLQLRSLTSFREGLPKSTLAAESQTAVIIASNTARFAAAV